MYKISVVVPVYNVENYLIDLMQSLLDQTYSFETLEIIFVNDGSSDGSAQIIDKFSREYSNVISYHYSSPSGASGRPRNIGIQLASAPYIIFADPDDYFDPQACEHFIQAMGDEPDIIMGTFKTSTNNKYYVHPIYKESLIQPLKIKSIQECPMLLDAPFNLMAKAYKTNFIKNIRLLFMEGVSSQDALFSTEAFFKSTAITFLPKMMFTYQLRTSSHNPSITQVRSIKYFQDFLKIRQAIRELYAETKILDYYEIRYQRDVYWLLRQYILMDLNQLETITQLIKPFIEPIQPDHLKKLPVYKQQIVIAILQNIPYQSLRELIIEKKVLLIQELNNAFN